MELLMEVVISVFAAFGVVCAVWCIVGRPIRSIPTQSNGDRLCVVVRAEGQAEEMEQDVMAAIWMKKHGLTGMPVVIVDNGMEPSARTRAELLCSNEDVMICGLWEILKSAEDTSGDNQWDG